ncbi:hypothetical protein [Streptomyces sp. NPDC056672]|uniref:hypothetical protein n=1 Tax=Streptomyces sp. NPDC056672 TaxID=3345906 RepID=UPI003682FEB7
MNTADPHVTFLSTDIIRAATDAAQLHRRCRGERFTRITFDSTRSGDRWNFRTGNLIEPATLVESGPTYTKWEGGGALITSVAEPPMADLPEVFADAARERVEAAARLAELVKDVPVPLGCGSLSIPLRPGR